MRHRTPRARGQPLRAVCPRNVVRLFRPLGRNWTTRINSGRPTVRLPQTEAWAERERVPCGHNCRRQLATGRPEQIQEPGTAVPGTPIFANNAQRGGPPLECRAAGFLLHTFLSPSKEKCERPTGRQVPLPRRSRRVKPRRGLFLQQSCRVLLQAGGFPRGKQSARPALPCAPLVVCLNSGSFPPSADSPLG